jgi:hypothetical protein
MIPSHRRRKDRKRRIARGHRRLHLGRPACHRNIPQMQERLLILGGFSLDCLILDVRFRQIYSYRKTRRSTGSMFAIVSAQNSVMG